MDAFRASFLQKRSGALRNPGAALEWIAKCSPCHGSSRAFKAVLRHVPLLPAHSYLFLDAAKSQHLGVLAALLEQSCLTPSAMDVSVLVNASGRGDRFDRRVAACLELFLLDGRVDPTYEDVAAVEAAYLNDLPRSVVVLLRDERVLAALKAQRPELLDELRSDRDIVVRLRRRSPRSAAAVDLARSRSPRRQVPTSIPS